MSWNESTYSMSKINDFLYETFVNTVSECPLTNKPDLFFSHYGLSLGDNTIISNMAIPFFIQSRYQEPFQVIEISENRDYKKYIMIKKKKRYCESSQKFHGNEIRTVFSAFGSKKQKRTTSEVRTRSASEFAIYCDACRRVRTCGYQL